MSLCFFGVASLGQRGPLLSTRAARGRAPRRLRRNVTARVVLTLGGTMSPPNADRPWRGGRVPDKGSHNPNPGKLLPWSNRNCAEARIARVALLDRENSAHTACNQRGRNAPSAWSCTTRIECWGTRAECRSTSLGAYSTRRSRVAPGPGSLRWGRPQRTDPAQCRERQDSGRRSTQPPPTQVRVGASSATHVVHPSSLPDPTPTSCKPAASEGHCRTRSGPTEL